MPKDFPNNFNQPKPRGISWVWFVLIIVAMLSSGYFAWWYYQKNKDIPLPINDNNTSPNIDNVNYIRNIFFYSTKAPEIYTDNKNLVESGLACATVMVDMTGKTIKVLYENDFGTVKIIKGGSSNGNCSINVEQGTFTKSENIINKIAISDLNSKPEDYLNKSFSIEGTLKMEGDYLAANPGPTFYLVDENDQKIAILSWLPMETLVGPGGEANSEIIFKYIDKKISISLAILERLGEEYIVSIPVGLGQAKIVQ